MKRILKITTLSILTFGLIYLTLLIYPYILFVHKIDYNNCTIYSDNKIDDNIKSIIDDAINRISKSDLYDRNIHFNIFICNKLWRFSIFTQGNMYAGAVTHYHLTCNIFFRPCDIPNNKIIPPVSWSTDKNPFGFSDRPLSYYFAHEMTHKLEANYTGAFDFGQPTWLTEGYADYIGKYGNFDFNENLKLLHNNAPELDPKLGLYRYYHLKVAYLLDKKGLTIMEVYKNTPDEKTLNSEIFNLPYN